MKGPPLQWPAYVGITYLVLYVVARLAIEALRRRRLRTAVRRFTEPGPARLSPGPTTLAGTVETDEPEGVAIRFVAPYRSFALDTKGELRWGLHADEAERSYEIHPFTLVVAGTGARVRIKPEEDVNLLSWPERAKAEPEPPTDSTRYALTLRAGERVLVSGLLARTSPSSAGYRGDEHDFVIHTPREGALVIEAEHFVVGRDGAPRGLRRTGDVIFAAVAPVHLILVLVDWAGTPLPTGVFATMSFMATSGVMWAFAWLQAGQEPERP